MNKVKFEGFINRYSLGGEVEEVTITSSGDSMRVGLVSKDQSLVGNVTMHDDGFPDGEFSIINTSHLKQLLGVLDESFKVDATPNSLKFRDKRTKVQYMLAIPSVIPAVPSLRGLPEFGVKLSLTSDFVSKFIKATNALLTHDDDKFTFICKNGVGSIVLGASSNNSNRISIQVDGTYSDDMEISFSAKYLKAILMANRAADAIDLHIAEKGLCHIAFDLGDFKSNYYLVKSA